ncbi:MAG TPA: hypothetical protein VNH11_29270 [Pirellulales bacterium]|nr:hypothetical protein [Pirellulales bacterium]
MAIFVEGRTELEFDTKLILEMAGATHPLTIEARTRRGHGLPGQMAKQIWVTHTGTTPADSTHFFLVWNCGSDSTVKSRMLLEYDYLVSRGYSKILCHRDLGPSVAYADLIQFEAQLPYRVKTDPIRPSFILSVMGIEAWFLSEHTHFQTIDPAITVAAIFAALGFDPSQDDMQLRPTPADDLNSCYAIGGKQYDKWNTQPTIDAIDYVTAYFEVADRFPHLRTLCQEIEDFLSTPPAAAA